MIINHNISALNTYRQLSSNNVLQNKSLEKLSSGFRINRAGDDAAGLAISEKMRGQIRGLGQASRNAQDGISLIQTAEGALNETHAILQRMRELAVQASTDTNTADDRAKIQAEVDQLASEITRISNTTEFNTRNLLAGGLSTVFHIGANQDQNVNASISAMDAYSLGIAGSSVSTTLTPANGITEIAQVFEDLGAGAKITVSNIVDATVTADKGDIAGAVTTTGSDYAGSVAKTITFEITQIGVPATGDVTEIKLGDGTLVTVNGGNFDLGEGITIQIADNASNAVGNSGKVDVTPKTVDLVLANNAGDLGTVQTVTAGQTSVNLGDIASGRTATVSFDFATLAAGDVSISQIITGSKAATTDVMGNVIQKATVERGVNVSTQLAADKSITTINNALEKVSEERSKLGAMQNRLEHTIANLDTSAENLQASESRIRDVDMAKEMMEFTKMNILSQAATAMLAQANQQPQMVLQLLR